MSLILVVEPDSLHAAQLQSMARTHLRAELVMADSADHAVAALAHRVPDIVLTAPLLPGHDEAVLSKYLRALGTAAAHVQTLMIPILSAVAAAPERTMLGRFRRERPRTEDNDGCDPAMFADQIGHYLNKARQSRGERASQPMPATTAATPEPLPVQAPPLMPPAPAYEPSSFVPSYAPMVVDEAFEQEGIEEEIVAPLVPQVMSPAVESVASGVPYYPDYAVDDSTVELVDDSADLAADGAAGSSDDDVIEMGTVGEDVDLSELLNELSAPALPPVALSRMRYQPAEPPRQRPAFFDPEVLVPAVLPRANDSRRRPRGAGSDTTARANQPLPPDNDAPPSQVQQHTIMIPSGNGGHVQASVNVSVAVAVQVSATTSVSTGQAAPPVKRRQRALKPAQDEWGFFDPDQCGFRALIARLDAIAQVEETE